MDAGVKSLRMMRVIATWTSGDKETRQRKQSACAKVEMGQVLSSPLLIQEPHLSWPQAHQCARPLSRCLHGAQLIS